MVDVAALYIDPRGPYRLINELDRWDVGRDARSYDGPYPIVAHPPCRFWGRLRHLAKADVCGNCIDWAPEEGFCGKCGGTGCVSDADCAPRAVEQVRKFGGVLEHPAGSKLWKHCGLPFPTFCPACDLARWRCACGPFAPEYYDSFGGYTIELDQCEWGHVARKRTWLYLVGVPRSALEAPPFLGREPTHDASGGRTSSSRKGGAVPAGIKVCSAQQRRRTPQLFAEYLIRLARAAKTR